MLETEKLYSKLKQLREDYLDIVNDNGGEITSEAEAIEKEIEELLNNKLENPNELYYIKSSYEKDIELLKQMRNQYTERINRVEEEFEKFKKLIGSIMESNGKSKLEGDVCSIKRRTVEELIIENKGLIPEDCWIEKIVKDINKPLLKEKLREVANDIEGAKLKEYETVTFYSRGVKNG